MPKLITSQARDIYDVIARSDMPLTAAQISRELNLLAPAVHRAIKQLCALRVIDSLPGYPHTYQASTDSNAIRWFLSGQKNKFLQEFPLLMPTFGVGQEPAITFIHSRQTLLGTTNKDITRAQSSVDFIVSGLQVPDETILAYRGAMLRGVGIRAIVQKKHETSAEKLEKWKLVGIQSRYIDSINTRMFIIDKKIAYITSYDQHLPGRATGVRFEYEPLSLVLSALFEEKWSSALPL